MNRHAYDLIFRHHFVEQRHLRHDDEATRTTPVFSREAMGFKMPERRVVMARRLHTTAARNIAPPLRSWS